MYLKSIMIQPVVGVITQVSGRIKMIKSHDSFGLSHINLTGDPLAKANGNDKYNKSTGSF
jgi:hypothetical protein